VRDSQAVVSPFSRMAIFVAVNGVGLALLGSMAGENLVFALTTASIVLMGIYTCGHTQRSLCGYWAVVFIPAGLLQLSGLLGSLYPNSLLTRATLYVAVVALLGSGLTLLLQLLRGSDPLE
jgi:hypothetical protein